MNGVSSNSSQFLSSITESKGDSKNQEAVSASPRFISDQPGLLMPPNAVRQVSLPPIDNKNVVRADSGQSSVSSQSSLIYVEQDIDDEPRLEIVIVHLPVQLNVLQALAAPIEIAQPQPPPINIMGDQAAPQDPQALADCEGISCTAVSGSLLGTITAGYIPMPKLIESSANYLIGGSIGLGLGICVGSAVVAYRHLAAEGNALIEPGLHVAQEAGEVPIPLPFVDIEAGLDPEPL